MYTVGTQGGTGDGVNLHCKAGVCKLPPNLAHLLFFVNSFTGTKLSSFKYCQAGRIGLRRLKYLLPGPFKKNLAYSCSSGWRGTISKELQ